MSHVRVLTRYIPGAGAVVNSCAAGHEQFTANERSRGRHSWKNMLPTVINRTIIGLPDAKNVTAPQYCSCS